MRLVTIAALVALALPLTAQADHDRDDEDWDRRADVVAMDRDDLLRRLDALERLMDDAVHEPNKKRRRVLARRAEHALDELKTLTADAPRVRRDVVPLPLPPPPPVVVRPIPPPPPPPPPQPVVYPIAPGDLARLEAALTREPFPQDRLRVLQSAAPSYWFVTGQIQQVLALFEFPKDRLKAMTLLEPRMLDRENGYTLYASFEFPSDKAKLKQLLEL